MTSVPEIYTQNFYEVCRAISDQCDRPEMGVTQFGVKFLTEQYIKQHSDQFDVKLSGDVIYLGGSDAKVGIPDGYDEDDPIDEYGDEDGYSKVPDDVEPLDFDMEDAPSIPDDEGDDDGDDGDGDPDGDDDGDDGKMTFTMSNGPPSSDD